MIRRMTHTYRIRSAETWTRARDDYLSGLDAESVCRRYDLGLSAFRRRARREGWRRVDHPDPAPGVDDLAIYDDIRLNEEIATARLRFLHALETGRALDAGRWRRLWRELWADRNRIEQEVFAGMTSAEIDAAMFEVDQDEEDEDFLYGEEPPEVHDVHPDLFEVQFSLSAAAGDAPPDALPGLEHRDAERGGGDPEQALGGDGGDDGEDQPGLALHPHPEPDEQADPAAHGDHGDQPGQGPEELSAPAHGGPGGGGGGIGLDGHGSLPRKSLSERKVRASARVFHRVGRISRRP